MDESQKDILMASVISDEFIGVRNIFNQSKLNTEDESFFDYELLKAALVRKNVDIVNFLLRSGCRVRNPNKINSEETPLHLAVEFNDSSVVIDVLKSGASIHDKNHEGDTPLCAGFKEKHYRAVDTVLNYYSTKDIDQMNSNLINPDPANKDDILHFHIACIRNKINAVNLYLKFGFNVNIPFSFDSAELSGLTPLHHAASKKHFKLFECLLKQDADISVQNCNGQTPLHIFYFFSHFGTIQGIVRHIFKYANSTKFINSTDSNDVSHFHICCALSYPDLIKVYIDNGVDVNSATSLTCPKYPGFTALHFAVLYNREKTVKLLLENGADCNKGNKEGTTPLHLACNSSSKCAARSIIEMLLDYKACATTVNEKGCTPLHRAFYNFNCDEQNIFDMLVSKIPRDVDFTDNKGLSHFHIVCTRTDISRVEDFLKSGVEVNSCVTSGRYSGYTALHFAVLHNQKDVVEILLKNDAQVNVKTNKLQVTPMHLACSCNVIFHEIRCGKSNNLDLTSNFKNSLEVIKLLLLYGADVNVQDTAGKTPLLRLCTYDKMFPFVNWSCHLNFHLYNINTVLKEIIEILLSNKANINAYANSKKSILHIICENSYISNAVELVEFLITNGSDINAIDHFGFTPLHIAVTFRKKKLVQIFLKHKANVNAVSKDFKIPLNLIIEFFNGSSVEKDILSLLLDNGSDVNIKYENDRNLLLDTVEDHKFYILEKLLNYGADINMEDSLGNPSIISILIKWQSETVNSINEANANIFLMIFTHMQKLLAVGFYVSEKIQKCCLKLHQHYRTVLSDNNCIINLDNVFDSCIEELNKMKLIKIDNYTTLYSILLKGTHELSKYVRNCTLINILEDQSIHVNFPLYGYLLKMQFKKGLIRSDVLEVAYTLLSSIFGLDLPDPCYDSVLKYLTNEEIANMKAAAPIRKNSLKRKLNKNDFSELEEPSAKLQNIQ